MPLSEEINTFKKLATDAHSTSHFRCKKNARKQSIVLKRRTKGLHLPTLLKSNPNLVSQTKQGAGGKGYFEYTFLEQDVLPAFHWMMERGMLKLPDTPVPVNVGKTSDPFYSISTACSIGPSITQPSNVSYLRISYKKILKRGT